MSTPSTRAPQDTAGSTAGGAQAASPEPAGTRPWLVPLGLVTFAVLAAGVLTTGVPPDRQVAMYVVLAVAAVSWLLVLSGLPPFPVGVTVALAVFGACGALLMVLQPDGPGFVAAYMTVAGLALVLPRRTALLVGVPVLAATALPEGLSSNNPLSHILDLVLGGAFLFLVSTYAAVNRSAHQHARQLLTQQRAARVERERSAALAERARLARELHDVLAHSLSGLSIQLEGARLLAVQTDADPRVVERIAAAHRLARDGMVNARRAVSALRGDELPGPGQLPELVADARTGGLTVTLRTEGEPWQLAPEAGLAVYRTVQEALTNTAKHAGPGAACTVVVGYDEEQLHVEIADEGGPGGSLGSAGGGYGLAGAAERAALLGGELVAGPEGAGWVVRLWLPRVATERENSRRSA